MVEFTAALVAELAIYGIIGELLARRVCGLSPWGSGIAEVAILPGLAAYALAGCLALPFALSAKAIPVAGALLVLSLWCTPSRPPAALPEILSSYRSWRGTGTYAMSLALAILLPALVTFIRSPWLLGLENGGLIAAGTSIFDDVRTLGGPIVLAAHGYPLRSPLAIDMQWPYPFGSFVYAAGWIAWMRSAELPLLLADAAVQSLFYTLAILVAAKSIARSAMAAALVCGSAFVSVSFNLWNVGLWRAGLMEYFFGYYRSNGLDSTIGWTPLTGLLWIGNHALGFAGVLLAFLWPRLAPLFAVFAASVSVDMPAMGLVLAGVIWLRWAWKRPRPPEFRVLTISSALALALMIAVNFGTLSGAVDSAHTALFPLNSQPRYTIGILACHLGVYLALLAWASIGARIQVREFGWWGASAAVLAVFVLLFAWDSIWFWRASFALHAVMGALCALAAAKLPDAQQRRFQWVWAGALGLGCFQAGADVLNGWRYRAESPPGYAQAMQWVARNTPIEARVVATRPREGSVTPDPGLLRAGNRGGIRPYDRSHALIGYKDYLRRFADLGEALASNDYLLAEGSDRAMRASMERCGAEVKFENRDAAVFAITETCRASLKTTELRAHLIEAQKPAHDPKMDPVLMPTEAMVFEAAARPEKFFLLRRRMDTLWSQGRNERALYILAKLLELNPEIPDAHYCYAYTLMQLGRELTSALDHFDRAMAGGFDPFWVHYNRGLVHVQLKNPDKARTDLRRAVELNPQHAEAAAALRALDQK